MACLTHDTHHQSHARTPATDCSPHTVHNPTHAVEMTAVQKQYYRAIYEKNFSVLTGGRKAADGA